MLTFVFYVCFTVLPYHITSHLIPYHHTIVHIPVHYISVKIASVQQPARLSLGLGLYLMLSCVPKATHTAEALQ